MPYHILAHARFIGQPNRLRRIHARQHQRAYRAGSGHFHRIKITFGMLLISQPYQQCCQHPRLGRVIAPVHIVVARCNARSPCFLLQQPIIMHDRFPAFQRFFKVCAYGLTVTIKLDKNAM